jgi:5-methylcytosine-specific restriction enzyme A
MALRAKRPCGKPGCTALISEGTHCEKHKQSEPRRKFDRQRGGSTQRGYGYRWQKLRIFIIRRDPFCMIGEVCDSPDPVTGKRSGRRAPSTDVDHILPKPLGTDHEENLQGACHACHSWKTATQDTNFAHKTEASSQGKKN